MSMLENCLARKKVKGSSMLTRAQELAYIVRGLEADIEERKAYAERWTTVAVSFLAETLRRVGLKLTYQEKLKKERTIASLRAETERIQSELRRQLIEFSYPKLVAPKAKAPTIPLQEDRGSNECTCCCGV